jgi:hypothetical protein
MTFSQKTSPEKRQEAVGQLIRELSADQRPILLGPWRSELGFECLYWLPFLKFLAGKVPDFDKRACIVTRGGLAPLYGAVAARGYDLYALRSVTDVRRENLYDHQNRGLQKQLSPTAWDGAVMADAAAALGLGALYHEIHPAWMYWALGPFWDDLRGVRYLAAMTDYAPLPRIALEGSPLPPKYVAVKFYARATFPYPHPEIAEFVQRTVGTLAAQVPVVVLGSQSGYDDHADIPVVGQNIFQLQDDGAPERNLQVQAAVIGQATAFVGTYGGTAQLALRLGVPSVSFWAEFGGTASAHLSLSRHLSNLTKVPFLTSSIGESLLWQQVTSVVKKAEVVAA